MIEFVLVMDVGMIEIWDLVFFSVVLKYEFLIIDDKIVVVSVIYVYDVLVIFVGCVLGLMYVLCMKW